MSASSNLVGPALCKALGLDPISVAGLTITLEPGRTVTADVKINVSNAQCTALIAAIEKLGVRVDPEEACRVRQFEHRFRLQVDPERSA